MAIGGVPTLMDMDWATINANQRAKNLENFKSQFMSEIKNESLRLQAKLVWDGSNLKYEAPMQGGQITRPMTESELWNRYSRQAQNDGLKVDLTYYEQQIAPIYRAFTSSNLAQQVKDLANRGLDAKHFKKLYKNAPNFANAYDYSITNTTDPEQQKELSLYRPQAGETTGFSTSQIIGAAGVTGAGIYGASQLDPKGGIGKNVRRFGPLGALLTAPMIAGKLGASDEQVEAMQTATTLGYPLYSGYGVAQSMKAGTKANFMNAMSPTIAKDTQANLIKKANALGLDVDDIKAKEGRLYNNLQDDVTKKIESQSVRKTKSAFKKAKIQTPKVKFGKPSGKSLASLAASIAIPMLLGQYENMFGEEEDTLPPLEDDERVTYDYENYDITSR